MPVDGIGTQRIADISPNNVQENGGGASIRSVMNAISVASAKAITPAGESVAVQNNEGNVFVFTPYYANSGGEERSCGNDNNGNIHDHEDGYAAGTARSLLFP